MKLIECYIKSFGGIKELRLEFGNGLNAFVGDNGVGKSTLAGFIKAMLYGLGESRKSSIEENDRKHYLPWDGSVAGGSLTFSAKGKTYRIERSFGKRPSDDSFALYDTRLSKRCEDFGENLGEELFGMDAESFERTAFFSERNLIPEADSSALGARGEGEGAAVAAELSAGALSAALDVLDEQRKIYQKKGGGGAIADTRARILEINSQLSSLDAVARRAKESEGYIRELAKRRAAATERSASITSRQQTLSERSNARRCDEKIKEIKASVAELEESRGDIITFFGGNIPTREQLDELSYKRKRAQELKLLDQSEQSEIKEYEALSAELDGKSDEDEIAAVREAVAVSARQDKEKAARIDDIFAKRIPEHSEIDQLIALHSQSSRGIFGLICTILGIILVSGGVIAGLLVHAVLYSVCAAGVILMATGITVNAVAMSKASSAREKKCAEFLSSIGNMTASGKDTLGALAQVKGLIDEAVSYRAECTECDRIIVGFISKFATRGEDKLEIARELLNKFDRLRELKIRGAGRDEVCPAIRGERLLLEVADALAEYNITSADPFEEVSRRLTEYEKINSELVSHEKELATLNAMRGLDVDGEDSDDTEESLARERSEVTAEISAIDRELAIRESGYNSDMMDLSSRELLLIEKERLSEKLAGLEGELRVVQSTRDYLSRAADAMNARYLEGALESFKRYSEMLLAAGADAQMSTDFSTSVVDGGGTRSTESYSRGTRDAYRLAARLAILDSLYSGEEPFLLLDDPFASFDDRRCDEGMALLERIGEEKQAIYFTCAESRGGRSAIRLGDMKK